MTRGKQTCRILKEIRRQIAEANGIEFITSECRYKGDCLGTCPKCEAEVRYLEQQLRARSLTGKAVALAGISATTLAMLMPMHVESRILQDSEEFFKESIAAVADTMTVKGVVLGEDTLTDGTVSREPLIGCSVIDRRSGKGTATNIDGEFSISAAVGDSLEVTYIGYESKTIVVTKDMADRTITLCTKGEVLMGVVEVVTMPISEREEKHYIDLYAVDEEGNPIDTDDLYIESPCINKYGEKDTCYIHPVYIDEKHPCRIYWDAGMNDGAGKPLKEIVLSIEAEGYDDPIVFKVKYPKRHTKKRIKFENKKK